MASVLYKSDGTFVHPLRFFKVKETKKLADGKELSEVRLRPQYYANAVFDEDDPTNPQKNNIKVVVESFTDEKGLAHTSHTVQWTNRSLKYFILPPLAVSATTLGPNGNYQKGGTHDPKEAKDIGQSKYSVCYNGNAYDDGVKDPNDLYERNKDWTDFERWSDRLRRWVIMYLWHKEDIKSNFRNTIKNSERVERMAHEKHTKGTNEPFQPYDKEKIIAEFDALGEYARGFINTPKPKDNDKVPVEARRYIAVTRRVFAKLKDKDKNAAGYKAPPPLHVVDPEPCPVPGVRRLPLSILKYTINKATGMAMPERMTRPEIDKIRSGDVMAAMVHIKLGVDDRNPATQDNYAINMKLEGANDDDMYFGPGANSTTTRNADTAVYVGVDDDGDTCMVNEVPLHTDQGQGGMDWNEVKQAYQQQQQQQQQVPEPAPEPDDTGVVSPMEEDQLDSPTSRSLLKRSKEEAGGRVILVPETDGEETDEESPKPKRHKAVKEPEPEPAPTQSKAFAFKKSKSAHVETAVRPKKVKA